MIETVKAQHKSIV